MTSRQAQIQEDTYFRVMRILQENPDLTQRELAEKLGVSVGGLNYCLKALMDKGWVKMQNFQNSKNKFKYPILCLNKKYYSITWISELIIEIRLFFYWNQKLTSQVNRFIGNS